MIQLSDDLVTRYKALKQQRAENMGPALLKLKAAIIDEDRDAIRTSLAEFPMRTVTDTGMWPFNFFRDPLVQGRVAALLDTEGSYEVILRLVLNRRLVN